MSEYQIFIIGLVASVIVWIFRELSRRGKEIPSAVLTIGVYIVSLILAVWWMGVQLPPFPPYTDPVTFASAFLAFLNDVLAIVGGYVPSAVLIYQFFVKYLLEKASH
jgi:hypothetical protein